jgi:SAM-dependent methyltransferase
VDATADTSQDWDAVADAWDAMATDAAEGGAGPEPTEAVTEAMVEALAVSEGERVLELAAGPGALAPVWSALVGPAGHVEITDLSPAMVEAAARRCCALANVEVAVLDAAALERPAGSVDVVASRMGLMLTPDPAAVLASVRRVLAPGGRTAAITWAAMEHNPWVTCVGMAAVANGVTAGGPPTGPGGLFSLGEPATLARLAEEAGLREVEVGAVDLAFRAPSVEDHVERVLRLAGPLTRALATASPTQRRAVRRTAAELVAPHATEAGGVAVPGRALLLVARR